MQRAGTDQQLWRQLSADLQQQWSTLEDEERSWIESRLTLIAELQERLHSLFLKAGGDRICAESGGCCCDRGRYHLTLVNLLGQWAVGREMPEPDFGQSCPWLSPNGCLLPAGQRPFNCITFLCEAVEDRLSAEDRNLFYGWEKDLRRLYEEFERRYFGASLRGLLLRAESGTLREGFLARR